MERRTVLLLFLLLVSFSMHAQRVVHYGEGISGSFGIFDMVEHDGKLIIGGQYSSFNGNTRNNIQAWDGVQHFDLPGAFESASSRVIDFELFEGDLIAAGREVDLGNVARWDGSAWSAMGSGLADRGQALVIFNGELVVGDQGGQVRRWTGSSWEPMGDGFDGQVTALAVDNGSLYAGGYFIENNSGGLPLGRIARWTGAAWEQVLNGLNNNVIDLLSTPDGLVIVGSFTSDGSGIQSTPNWTIYDGSSFSEELALPNSNGLTGVCAYPSGGYLICGDRETIHIGSNGVATIPFTSARSAITYGGDLLIAGMGDAPDSYSFTRGIGRVIPGKYRDHLDLGPIRAGLTPTFGLFNGNGQADFEVPQGAGVHSIYSSQPIVVGVSNGIRQATSIPYGIIPFNMDAPFPAGPIAIDEDDSFKHRYFQVWKVDRNMIHEHLMHWADPGYEVPYALVTWPGNGDVTNGEPDRIAAFKDIDMDGIYEPGQGEFPLIRGDQAILQVLHTGHSPGTSLPLLSADMTLLSYVYNSSGNNAVGSTVFTHLRMVNRTGLDLSQLRFGMLNDFDIGCPIDDFAGCDSTRNLHFIYNWDDIDENCAAVGYQDQPPAQGMKYLNHDMSSHKIWYQGEPLLDMEDLMNGTQGGQPFTQLGYPSNFQFPGGAFIETNQGVPDRRALGAIGPFDLASGDTLCVDMAFIYARASTGGAYASVEALKLRADSVQAFYDAQGFDCTSDPDLFTSIRPSAITNGFRIYPNPTRASFVIERPIDSGVGTFVIRTISGALVQQGRLGAGTKRTTVPLGEVGPGLYLVELRSAEGGQVQRLAVE